MLNRDNLLKLAAYLDTLPDDYPAFEMSCYFTGPSLDVQRHYARFNGGVTKCGAVACAVGHGPAAGLLFPEELIGRYGPDWGAYANRMFFDGERDQRAFFWMFSDNWHSIDNTPAGAARRIRHILNGGGDAWHALE